MARREPPPEIADFIALAQERGYTFEFDSFGVKNSRSVWVDIETDDGGISVQFQTGEGYGITTAKITKGPLTTPECTFKTLGSALRHVAKRLHPKRRKRTYSSKSSPLPGV